MYLFPPKNRVAQLHPQALGLTLKVSSYSNRKHTTSQLGSKGCFGFPGSGNNKQRYLLGKNAVQTGKSIPTFRRETTASLSDVEE
jgi:hypothetical protein